MRRRTFTHLARLLARKASPTMSDSLTRTPARPPTALCMTALALLVAQGLGGCTAVSNSLAPNKVDYRAQAQPASTLDVPPDLTQLASDPRYQPPTKRGDLLAVFTAGAYGFAMSSNYNNRPRAAEVLVDGDSYRVIRRRETMEDMVMLER